MSYVEQTMAKASQMPLCDAAFWLWINKHRLDQAEPRPVHPPSHLDLRASSNFAETVRIVAAIVQHEQATAHDGPTFHRMRLAHPEAPDNEIKGAIRQAVKFYREYVRNFSYKNQNYLDDVTEAIEAARLENPGFLEETYKQAWKDLAKAMR